MDTRHLLKMFPANTAVRMIGAGQM